jgi:hypothetical protein
MKTLLSIGAVLLFVAVSLAQQAPVTFSSSRLSARVDSTSGGVQIWESDTDRIFTHKFRQMQELGTNMAVENAVNSFDNQLYTVRADQSLPCWWHSLSYLPYPNAVV